MKPLFPNIERSTRVTILSAMLGVFLTWGGVLWLRQQGSFERLELRIYDSFVRARSKEVPTPNPLVMIEQRESDITDASFWDYPLTDGQLSDLLEKIMTANPAVVAVDIYRDLPVPKDGTQREKLNLTLQKYPNILTILNLSNGKMIPPPKILADDPMRASANDLPVDDGETPFVRRGFLFLDDRERNTHYSLAFLASASWLATQNIAAESDPLKPELMRLGAVTIPKFHRSDGAYAKADDRGYQFLLDFRRKLEIPAWSLREVMDGSFEVKKLQGKIVLLGVRASSVHDASPSPLLSSHRGLDLHAQAIDQLLDWALGRSSPMQFWSEKVEAAWIFLFCLLGLGTGMIFRTPLGSFLSTLGLLVAVPAFGWWLFASGVWVPVLAPMMAVVVCCGFAIALQRFRESQDRKIVMRLFSRHVSTEVAGEIWRKRDTIMQRGKIPGQLVDVTVLMTDIADYSTISEKMKPAELFEWLDEYMAALSRVVTENSGIVNKYIGDAIFAVFGIPIPRTTEQERSQDAVNAVRCALGMRVRLAELNRQWVSKGMPATAMRVGIYSGPAVCGSFGGSETMEYGLIGDTVNTGSRLESFDKTMVEEGEMCRILVGESTWQLCGDRFIGKAIGQLKLKGKNEMPTVYSVTGEK